MISAAMFINPCVWERSGDFLSVQLMNSAFKSEKSQLISVANWSIRSVIDIRASWTGALLDLVRQRFKPTRQEGRRPCR